MPGTYSFNLMLRFLLISDAPSTLQVFDEMNIVTPRRQEPRLETTGVIKLPSAKVSMLVNKFSYCPKSMLDPLLYIYRHEYSPLFNF